MAQTPPPPVAETPASDLARRMIAAAQAGDADFLAFIREANPHTQRPDAVWRMYRQQLAALQVHGLAAATPTRAELWAYDPRLEAWVRFGLDVTAASPPTITGLAIRATGERPPGVAPPTALQPDDLAAALRVRLEGGAADDGFSGAALVAREGRTIFSGAYGLADREAGVANKLETQFRFGSMGKMFTAVAAMQLAQAGVLDLAAPLGRYLPDYPDRDIAGHVTAGHLLSHTGGTGDIFGPEFAAHRLALKDPADYVALFGPRAAAFAAGTRFEYSNYGFVLLGRVIEAASGLSYDEVLAARIFAPAGMTATGNRPETDALPNRAAGYTSRGGLLASAADSFPWRGTPAGGGYATVGDLQRFADALTGGRLLDAAHLAALCEGGVTGPDGQFHRYDFGQPAQAGRRVLGHGGGAPGMSGELRIFPAEGGRAAYTVAVLANRDAPVAQGIANFITDRLP